MIIKRKRVLISLALICSLVIFNTVGISATDDELSISQMEEKKQANQEEIDKLQKQIDEAQKKLENAQNDEKTKQKYQQDISDKIKLQQENISYVEDQITELDNQINTLNDNIAYLEQEMSSLKVDIDANMQQFKKRLKAMYISGNDSLASILIGSNDFFDVLTKMEFIARISSHDNALMETLKSQINDYNEDMEILTLTKNELETKKEQSTNKREEFSEILTQLSADFKNTQDELEKIELEKEALNMSIEDLQGYQQAQEEEEKLIQEAIKNYYAQSSIAQSKSIVSSVSESKSVSLSEQNSISIAKSISYSKSEAESIEQSIEESLLSSLKVSESMSEYESVSNSIEESKRQTTRATTQAPVVTTPEPVVITTTTEAIPVNNYLTGGTFNWPVPNFYTITDYYDVRTWNNQGMHYGIDISGINVAGADIVSAEAGTVILAINTCTHDYPKYSSCGCGGGFGNYVIVDHGGGYCTLYGHCQSVEVSTGDYVSRGQVIAHVGSTGYSTGYHLHFEVRYNGERIDPLPFLS